MFTLNLFSICFTAHYIWLCSHYVSPLHVLAQLPAITALITHHGSTWYPAKWDVTFTWCPPLSRPVEYGDSVTLLCCDDLKHPPSPQTTNQFQDHGKSLKGNREQGPEILWSTSEARSRSAFQKCWTKPQLSLSWMLSELSETVPLGIPYKQYTKPHDSPLHWPILLQLEPAGRFLCSTEWAATPKSQSKANPTPPQASHGQNSSYQAQ